MPPAAAADGRELLAEVEALVEASGPRPAGSPAAARATDWTAARLREAGVAFEEVEATFGEAAEFWRDHELRYRFDESRAGLPLCNLLADFPQPGQRPADLPGRILVLGHTDSVAVAPGAEDNASGVALCLDLCRFLQAHPPRRRVTVAFTDGEEIYLLGAAALAARMKPAEVAELSLALAVEMSGWNERPYLHWFASTANFRGQPPPPDPILAAILGSGTAAGSFGQAGPLSGWLFPALRDHISIARDADHRPFEMLGRPAVMMTTSSLSAFYPHYHTARDTPDKLSAATLGRSASALRAAVHALGSAEELGSEAGSYGYPLFGRVVGAGWLRAAFALLGLGFVLTGRPAAWLAAGAFVMLAALSPPSLLGAGLALPAGVFALALRRLRPAWLRGLLFLPGLVPTLFAAAFVYVAFATFGSGTALHLALPETVAVAVGLAGSAWIGLRGPVDRRGLPLPVTKEGHTQPEQ